MHKLGAGLSTAAMLAVFAGGCAIAPLFTREISFTQQEMTERLAKRFPVERNIADLLQVKLTRPRVTIASAAANAAPQLAVGVDLEVKLPLTGKMLFGQMALSGVPRYDATARAIFLAEAKVDRVRVDNMPDALAAALARAATQFAGEYFAEKPIYALDANEIKRMGQFFQAERITMRADKLVLVLK